MVKSVLEFFNGFKLLVLYLFIFRDKEKGVNLGFFIIYPSFLDFWTKYHIITEGTVINEA
jgi:hypothetical protein